MKTCKVKIQGKTQKWELKERKIKKNSAGIAKYRKNKRKGKSRESIKTVQH